MTHIIQNKSTFYIIMYALHLSVRKVGKQIKQEKTIVCGWSHLNVEGGARDVVIPPLNIEDVLALIQELVGHTILAVALVLHMHLITRSLRTIHSNKQHIITSTIAVHHKGVLLADQRTVEAWAGAGDG